MPVQKTAPLMMVKVIGLGADGRGSAGGSGLVPPRRGPSGDRGGGGTTRSTGAPRSAPARARPRSAPRPARGGRLVPLDARIHGRVGDGSDQIAQDEERARD